MGTARAARRVWSNASSHWSWSRVSFTPSSSYFSHHLTSLSSFSRNLSLTSSRFFTPLLFSPSNPSFFIPRLTSAHGSLFIPFNKWIAFSGPLFLSSPTWQLSQSATPLYPPGKFVFRENEWKGEEKKSCQQRINAFVKKHLPEGVTVLGQAGRWQVATDVGLVKGDQPVCDQSPSFNGSPRVEISGPHAWSVGAVNLPNAISVVRMLSGPLLGWMILNELYYPAFVGLLVAGVSDWLDGYVARRLRVNSVLGSYLDPLADKVLICCVALCMIKNDLLHPALVALVVTRDCVLVGGAFYKRAHSLDWQWKDWSDFFNVGANGAEKVDPLFISKVNTVLQLALVGTALLQSEIGTDNAVTLVTWLSWSVAATTLASWAGYGLLHFRKGSQRVIRSSRMFSSNKGPDC
eukprot:Gb_27275 [translate_table: standard]